jgi:hypothetical protein
MVRHTSTYEREVLYQQVWNEPGTAVAKHYAISGSALGRICEALNVPRPERGYWTKVRRGLGPPIPPLPPDARVAKTTVHHSRILDRERIELSMDDGRSISGAPIIVGEVLGRMHPLIAASKRTLARSEVRHGRLVAVGACVDISVSPDHLDRALRVMNTLLHALEERGLPVEVVALPGARPTDPLVPTTRVSVHGEWIRFGVTEELVQHRPPQTAEPPKGLTATELEWWSHINRPRMQLLPSGVLTLRIKHEDVGARISWRDGQAPIETRLNEFVQQLFVVADAIKQIHEANLNWNKKWLEDEAAKRAQAEADEREARELAELQMTVARWREARELRAFIADMAEVTDPRLATLVVRARKRAQTVALE